jgi:hypothetical protein
MELKRAPEIVVVAATISPLVWTLGARATLVLPGELLSSLGAKELRTLIAHELAHLRRRDHWWRVLELLAIALYWWFPVAWWARGQLRKVEEECCDGWVDWAFPDHRREYASTLLHTVDFLSRSPAALPEGVSGMGQVSILKRRLMMILQGRLTRRLPAASQVWLLSFAALVLPWATGLSAQDKPEAGKAPPAAESPPAPPARPGGKSPAPPPPADGADEDAWPATEPPPPPGELRSDVDSLLRQLKRLQESVEALRERSDPAGRVELPAGPGAPGPNRPGDGRQWEAGRARLSGKFRSADGKPRVFQVDGGTVTLQDPRTNTSLWTAKLGDKVIAAEILPDGKQLLVRAAGKTMIIDLATGKTLREDKVAVAPREAGEDWGEADSPIDRKPSDGKKVDFTVRRPGWTAYGAVGVGEGGGAVAGPRVDLVQLADALIEAEGAAKSAQNRLESPVDPDGTVKLSPTEAKAARIQADTAAKKADLLRRMARSALKRTSDEVKRLEELEVTAKVRFKAQQVPVESLAALSGRLAQARLAVDLLEEILAEPRQ